MINYLNTSVDDCKTSLQYVHDLEFLEALLVECKRKGNMISKERVIASRIRKVKKAVAS